MAIRANGNATGGAPSGSAGGALGGTYPNPTIPALATGWTTYTPTFTGFGTVTVQNFQTLVISKIQFVFGRFTSGISTAVEARVSIPVAAQAAIATIQNSGSWSGSGPGSTATGQHVLIEPSIAYVTFGYQGISQNGQTKSLGNVLVSSGGNISFFAIIPID